MAIGEICSREVVFIARSESCAPGFAAMTGKSVRIERAERRAAI